MQVEYKKSFLSAVRKLNKSGVISEKKIYDIVDDFIKNPDKNSFDNKHIKGCSRYKNMWQIRVSIDYRILYLDFEDYIVFHFIGSHHLVDKMIKNC